MDDDTTTTTSTAHDDGYNEYITPQRKRKKRSKVWRELIEGKNVQGAWMVHRHLLEAEKGPYDYLQEMVKPMLEKFDKYWSDYNLYLSCAAIFYPRYKVKFVEYCFSKLYGSVEASRQINLVLGTMKSMFEDYKLQYASTSPIVVTPPPPSTSGARNYFDDYDHFVGTSTRSQVGKSQLEMYLDDDPLDLNSQLDILEF